MMAAIQHAEIEFVFGGEKMFNLARVPQLPKSALLLTLAVAAVIVPTSAWSSPANPCLVLSWSAPSVGTNPPVPANYNPGGNAAGLGFFAITFNLPAPPASGIPGCNYVFSDITLITLSYTVTGGPMEWQTLKLPPAQVFPGPYIIGGTGSGTIIQPLAADQFDLVLPQANFPATLLVRVAPFDHFIITGASGTISGDHYYVVPEPNTLILIGSGLLGLGGFVRRRVML